MTEPTPKLRGAAGYVLKDVRGGDLVGAVRTVPPAARCWTRGRRRG